MVKYLIFGNGFIGNKFLNFLPDSIVAEGRINTFNDIYIQIDKHQPEIIINCIGKTGRPNIDWCQLHKEDTFFSNVTVPIFIAEACKDKNIFMVHIGSGCIYEGDNNGRGWNEEDEPNFRCSFYSKTKIFSETILKGYDNVLILRIRMPIDNMPGNRNLIDKLVGYTKVINVENSITCIPDLMEITKKLIDTRKTGIYNVVQPGSIVHRDILNIYKEIVDPKYDMPEFIRIEELKGLTLAGRSNCLLSIDKLKNEGIEIKNVKDAIKSCMINYANYKYNRLPSVKSCEKSCKIK